MNGDDALLHVNLGCGPVQPDGWTNIDNSNRAKLASRFWWLDSALVKLRVLPPTEFGRQTTVMDLRRPLEFATDTVAAFYLGEVLEHLTPAEADELLAECVRSLRPGGVLRACVPDMVEMWARYLAAVDEQLDRPGAERSDTQIRGLMQQFFDDICVRRPWFGSMGHFHKWGYDEVQLTASFEAAGLGDVARRARHDSAIEDIAAVETRNSSFLILEGTKPLSPR